MASKTPSPSLSPSGKGKRKILSISEKFEVIQDHERGMTRAQLMEKYSLKKTTIHNLLKAKEKVKKVMKGIETSTQKKKGKKVYRKRRLALENLIETVFKWYTQERAEGVPVRGIDIQHAAQRLATHLGHKDFTCSDGRLWHFRRRHGIGNRAI